MNISAPIFRTIDQGIEQIMARVREATQNREVAVIESLAKAAADLEHAKEIVSQVEARVSRLNFGATEKNGVPPDRKSMREIVLEVTDGSIRQNLLILTTALRQRLVRFDEKFVVEALPSGERFETSILEKGNKFQERGAVARFYRDAKVRGGDRIRLSERSPGVWSLEKMP